jgi:uncharacterized protein (DUF433 family)
VREVKEGKATVDPLEPARRLLELRRQHCAGAGRVGGARISVELVVDLLATGWSHEQILASYPRLSETDIRACLAYASELLREEKGLSPQDRVSFLTDENFLRLLQRRYGTLHLRDATAPPALLLHDSLRHG